MATKKKEDAVDKLLIKDENGWHRIDKREEKAVHAFAADYVRFLSLVKTEREAHDFGRELAAAHGFRDAGEVAPGALKAGDRVCFSAGGKTLILVQVGKAPLTAGLQVIGGHTDSPRLDLKPRPIYEDGDMVLLDTHYYGGIKKFQWVAIPLALHGVVVRKDGSTVQITIGENADDPVFTITDLLPHLGRGQAEKKMSDGITGEGLNVLAGSRPTAAKGKSNGIKLQLLKLLHDHYSIDEADLMSAELEIVPAGPARELGLDRSMILGYGHDDRVSAYTALRAMLDRKGTPARTAVCVLCDKEEIGSVGATGMNGRLFENTMAELLNLTNTSSSELDLRRCLRNSQVLSADVNALHDPNYPEVSSPNRNMARLNYGLVLTKYVGARGKSGTNDASAEFMARVRGIFDRAGVVWQTGEIGKVDEGGGGTIAYMLARYEMDVVDCGVGVLSMHAPWEVAGKLDIYMAYKGYSAFFGAD